jgi:hypothetical protein
MPQLHFSFVCARARLCTVGRTSWAEDQPVARPLPKQKQNKRRHLCLLWDPNPRSQRSSGRRQFMLWPCGHCDRLHCSVGENSICRVSHEERKFNENWSRYTINNETTSDLYLPHIPAHNTPTQTATKHLPGKRKTAHQLTFQNVKRYFSLDISV